MEFGPRALGNRSIVADPRRADMKDILNQRIKHRETYRPFAPSVLEEKAAEIFERSEPSPFMLHGLQGQGGRIAPASRPSRTSTTPAACRRSARQTNPRYHALISEFDRADRRPAGAEHQLQRARADRRDAGRGARLLPQDADGRARAGQLGAHVRAERPSA